ncbi:outer membrane protein transport protein [Ectothiorhodospiraceae bacterium 2226]|nr:outer membrane protein transport protein [Ectothiorhodospiraceae bacterium 2226]
MSNRGGLATAVAFALAAPGAAWATNGMNLEGYGAVAAGMGGAALAYDNGTAALMNNPATLGFMAQGHRIDAAVGVLGPDVTSRADGAPSAESRGTRYVMPAVGWARKQGRYTYGLAVFAQGGMGTDYAADSFLAMGSGDRVLSELGVGRVMAPLVFEVNETLSVGGSVDFVWAGLDLMMAAPGAQLGAMMSNPYDMYADPAMQGTLGSAQWARIDFRDSNDFRGAAYSTGIAGKLGVAYRPTEALSFGATYHSKTDLRDMEASNARLSAEGGFEEHGTIRVRDFQWPETYGVGAAYQAARWMVAADVMRIHWADVMQDFRMSYASDSGGFDITMPQNWRNQTVYRVGGAYRATPRVTLRAGFNYGKNPIPDQDMNPLFPATTERHYTAGLGYELSAAQTLNFALAYAPEVTRTNGQGVTVDHSQTNWQLMYSHRF